jgi:hypothetical protein
MEVSARLVGHLIKTGREVAWLHISKMKQCVYGLLIGANKPGGIVWA